MIDTSAGTAGATLQRLMKELAARRNRYDILQMYYDGENGIPAYADAITRKDYRGKGIVLERFAEMARFNYGSTVIVLLPKGVAALDPALRAESPVRLGERLAMRP